MIDHYNCCVKWKAWETRGLSYCILVCETLPPFQSEWHGYFVKGNGKCTRCKINSRVKGYYPYKGMISLWTAPPPPPPPPPTVFLEVSFRRYGEFWRRKFPEFTRAIKAILWGYSVNSLCLWSAVLQKHEVRIFLETDAYFFSHTVILLYGVNKTINRLILALRFTHNTPGYYSK